MGHLINPISLQIKYHGSWKVSWSQYLRKDFGFFFFIDQYFKNVLQSILYLKTFFNKFFFFEVKYFIKDNVIFFFFSFKFIRKTKFKYYWFYRHYKYKFSRRRKLYKLKTRRYNLFLKVKGKESFTTYSLKRKGKFEDRFARQNPFEPPTEFPLSSFYSSIV